MGCDIHVAVEVRGDEGDWHLLEAPPDPNWYNERRWYHGRNYDLFAVLAGVRNRHPGERNPFISPGDRGWKETDGGEAYTPIDEPRGLPDDMSSELRTASGDDDGEPSYWLGDHSWSYLSLSELLAHNWDQQITTRTLISDVDERHPQGGRAEWAQKFATDYGELPSTVVETCKGIGGSVERVAQYREIEWSGPIWREMGAAWLAFMLRLQRLTPKGDPARIRLVFGFDS